MARRITSYPASVRVRAQELRREGYTYAEIQRPLGPIPKSTLAHWLKDISLTEQQQLRIHAKILASAQDGRPLARAAWATKMQRWRERIEAQVMPFGQLPYTDSFLTTIRPLENLCAELCIVVKEPNTQRHNNSSLGIPIPRW